MCYTVHMTRAARAKPTASTTLTVRMPATTKRRVERVARAVHRSKSHVTLEAIETFLEFQEWQEAAIREGIKDFEEGRTVPHDEVRAWLLTLGTDKERPPP